MSEEKPVAYKYKQLFRWNIDDDAYKPSIAVYENGAVEIVVGGHGIGTNIEKIFESLYQPKEHLCWKEIDRLKKAAEEEFQRAEGKEEMKRWFQEEITRLNSVIDLQAKERWAWSEKQTKEVRELVEAESRVEIERLKTEINTKSLLLRKSAEWEDKLKAQNEKMREALEKLNLLLLLQGFGQKKR